MTHDYGLLTQSKSFGFTLIEAMVAISVLLVAIAGPLTIASRGLSIAGYAKQQVVATYLAEEAVEFIRNKRDTNMLNPPTDWLNGLSACVGVTSTCTVDMSTGNIAACTGGECDPIRYNTTSGTYGYGVSGWQNTEFTREVSIRPTSGWEVKVISSVSWSSGVGEKTITVEDVLFDWVN